MVTKNKNKNKSRSKGKKQTSRFRQAIALEAAKLMYNGTETEYFTAKRKAARQFGVHNSDDLPSNKEIRQEILKIADFYEGESRKENLKEMRIYALWIMEELQAFHPKLVGSTLTGHVRKGSDIDIHIFCDSLSAVTQILDNIGLHYDVERKRVVKYNTERVFTHIHVHGRFEIEMTLYTTDLINYRFKSSITGKFMERATIPELRQLLNKEYPDIDLDAEISIVDEGLDKYEMFKLLLLPLEEVAGGPHHPEGDILFHSLQVFELAKEWHGYDLEFLQGALLHDVGKAIDPRHHAEAGAYAVEDFVSERVVFLIRHHMEALELKKGTLGHRKKVFLKNHDYFEDLMLLRDLDDRGREPGMIVDTLQEALDYLKNLEQELKY